MRDMREIKKIEQKFESCLACGNAVLALHYHRQLSAAYICLMHEREDLIFESVGQLEQELDGNDIHNARYANIVCTCLFLFFAFWYLGLPYYLSFY